MNTIKEWADFYTEKRLWVYPYNLEEKEWLYWKSMKSNYDYNDLFQTWDWNKSAGIKLVIGKKGVRVIEVSNKRLLKKALQLLDLPENYSWIICHTSGYGIIVDTPNVSKCVSGMTNKSYKSLQLLWEGYYVLPCVGVPRYFYKNNIPTEHPKQVTDEVYVNCVKDLIKNI